MLGQIKLLPDSEKTLVAAIKKGNQEKILEILQTESLEIKLLALKISVENHTQDIFNLLLTTIPEPKTNIKLNNWNVLFFLAASQKNDQMLNFLFNKFQEINTEYPQCYDLLLINAVAKKDRLAIADELDNFYKNSENQGKQPRWKLILKLAIRNNNEEVLWQILSSMPEEERTAEIWKEILFTAPESRNLAMIESLFSQCDKIFGAEHKNSASWTNILSSSSRTADEKIFDYLFEIYEGISPKPQLNWEEIFLGAIKSLDEAMIKKISQYPQFQELLQQYSAEEKDNLFRSVGIVLSNSLQDINSLSVIKILRKIISDGLIKDSTQGIVDTDIEIKIDEEKLLTIKDLSYFRATNQIIKSAIDDILDLVPSTSPSLTQESKTDLLSQLPKEIIQKIAMSVSMGR